MRTFFYARVHACLLWMLALPCQLGVSNLAPASSVSSLLLTAPSASFHRSFPLAIHNNNPPLLLILRFRVSLASKLLVGWPLSRAGRMDWLRL